MEAGIDQGGLLKEFLEEVVGTGCAASYGLMATTPAGQVGRRLGGAQPLPLAPVIGIFTAGCADLGRAPSPVTDRTLAHTHRGLRLSAQRTIMMSHPADCPAHRRALTCLVVCAGVPAAQGWQASPGPCPAGHAGPRAGQGIVGGHPY